MDQEAGPSARRAGRNVVALVVGEVLGKAATLAFTVVVARQLGAEAFGSFSYALAAGILLATVVSWGFDDEVLRRGSSHRPDLDAVLTRTLALKTLHAVPVVALGVAFAAVTGAGAAATEVLVLVLLATVLDGYGNTGRAAAAACERPGPAALVLTLQRVVACVLAVAVIALGGDLLAVSAAYLASSVVGLVLVAYLVARLGVRPRLRHLGRADLRTLWRGTFLLGVETVLGVALFRVDALMLGVLAGEQEVATYAVGYRVMETVLFVTWAVSGSLFPAMVRAEPGEPQVRVAQHALAVTGAVFLPYAALMLLDGGMVIRLLFGDGFPDSSVLALQWLAVTPVVFALTFFCNYLLFVQRRTGWMLAGTAAALAVNIALNAVLIPSFGAVGAAFTTTATYLLQGALCVYLVAQRATWLRIDRALWLCAAASVPFAAVLWLLPLPVLVEAPLAGVAYLAGYLLLARWKDPAQIALLRSLGPGR